MRRLFRGRRSSRLWVVVAEWAAALALLAALLLLLLSEPTIAISSSATLPSLYRPCAAASAGRRPLLAADRFYLVCQALNISSPFSLFLTVSFNTRDGLPIWIANPSLPVSPNASLILTPPPSARLVLSDLGAPAAWTVDFSVHPSHLPASMKLDGNGNLLIVDSENTTLWQSFLHPFNVLVPGQIMTPGMQLHSQAPIDGVAARRSTSYSAVMDDSGLALFVNLSMSSSLPYYFFGFESTSGRQSRVDMDAKPCGNSSNGSSLLQLSYDGTQLILECTVNASTRRSLSFGFDDEQRQIAIDSLQLDSDGNMRGYKYNYSTETWQVMYDLFLNSYYNGSNMSYGVCSLPDTCGTYGVCESVSGNGSSSYRCSCPRLRWDPDNADPVFLPINSSDARQGCQLSHPLNCSLGSASQYFMELQGADYFASDILPISRITTQQDCLAICARNCTCKAAFYREGTNACFHFEQVLTIVGLTNSSHLASNLVQATDKVGKLLTYSSNSAKLSTGSSTQLGTTGSTELSGITGSANFLGYIKVQNISVSNTTEPSSKAGRKYLIMTLGMVVGSTLAGLFLLGMSCWLSIIFCKKRRTRKFKTLREESFRDNTLARIPMLHFTFKQLQLASGDFKCKLGVGGFGSVYKGTLSDGSVVAIKQLENVIRADKEFNSQVMFLHCLCQANLIRLIGSCMDGSRRLLVSEYMVNGSLDAWIFSKHFLKQDRSCVSSPSFLEWNTRFSVALNVAKGLAYLHEAGLIHLNLKPQNILLDEGFVAKLSDYGLSRLMDQEEGHLATHMRCAMDYMAPEWLQHACATEKSDVYSYGMVLMEMLGGRKIVDLSKERESWFLPALAVRKYIEGRLPEILEERLGRTMKEAEWVQAKRLLQVSFWCIAENPNMRPDMKVVLWMLEGHEEIPEPPLPLNFGEAKTIGCNLDRDEDSDHQFHHIQSGSSSPSCFNIASSEMLCTPLRPCYVWPSNGGQQDDCSLLLPSQD